MSNFKVTIGINDITINEEKHNTITFAPSEVMHIIHLLGIANSLSGFKVPPPHIQNTPFRVYFETDKLVLFKKGQDTKEGLKFTFKEIDNIIKLLHSSVDMFKDKHTLDKKKR